MHFGIDSNYPLSLTLSVCFFLSIPLSPHSLSRSLPFSLSISVSLSVSVRLSLALSLSRSLALSLSLSIPGKFAMVTAHEWLSSVVVLWFCHIAQEYFLQDFVE